jgi:hypothetical protein
MRSLRRLKLTREPVHVSPTIAGLTALQSLELFDNCIFAADAHLPAGITRLLVERDAADEMPVQFTQLPRLQRLELEGCAYSGGSLSHLSALGSSLTRLDVSAEGTAAVLAALTRLQHLDSRIESETARQTMTAALPHLTGLTCLVG